MLYTDVNRAEKARQWHFGFNDCACFRIKHFQLISSLESLNLSATVITTQVDNADFDPLKYRLRRLYLGPRGWRASFKTL